MATKLRKSGKGQHRKDFHASFAVVIGINDYANGIQKLTTPVNDAARLAEQLERDHGYTVHLLVEDVTKARLESYFTQELPPAIAGDDRLLIYFAGHGVALDGEDGPQGFLLPVDADPQNRDSFLPMTELHDWLNALPPRHMLAILDCCFAGAFRWAATRAVNVLPAVIHRERFDRYLISPAWQVLTSAAYDQTALDVVAGRAVGSRGIREADGERHSPFALALYDALRGEGDLIPKGGGDGVITATELYLYLREQVEIEADERANHDQTPGLWPLNKHGKGEFIFLTPGHDLNLPPAPDLTEKLNPWRGLKSYNEAHRELFFGRDQEIEALCARVDDHPFTAVLGASGSGKSSLVKAGLMPSLEDEGNWLVLPPLRPGATPILNLQRLLEAALTPSNQPANPRTSLKTNRQALAELFAARKAQHPGERVLLVVDQLEELVTLADDDAREQFLALLAAAVDADPDTLRLVITLRTDFEPQFDAQNPLAPYWGEARAIVPPMNQAHLRQVIEGPASVRVLYFEPPELVDQLITEVIQTPGALPLLSFTLSEMYIHYLRSGREDRALTLEDYQALGGVIGSLRTRANEEFHALPDEAHRATMRKVMLRMISVEGGELARRRVRESELVYSEADENERVHAILERLVRARLLVSGEEEGEAVFEPAHDALVLAWDNLLRWKKEAESYLLLQRQLSQAVKMWTQAAPDARSGFLWDDDPRLPQLEDSLWPSSEKREGLAGRLRRAKRLVLPDIRMPQDTRWLNDAEVTFVQHSVGERAQFWRRTIGITFIVLLVIGALLAFGYSQQQQSASNLAAAATAQSLQATSDSNAQLAAENEATSIAAEATSRADEATAVAAQATAVAAQATSDSNAALAGTRESDARAAEAEVQVLKDSIQASQLLSTVSGASTGDQELDLLLATAGLGLSSRADTIAKFYEAIFAPYRLAVHGHRRSVRMADFSPDLSRFVTASNDGSAKVWDLRGNQLASLDGHEGAVVSAAFSPDGELIVTAGSDDSARLWRLDGTEITSLLGHEDALRSAVFSPDGERILTASDDGTARVWDLQGRQLVSLDGHEDAVLAAEYSQDGSRILTAGADNFVRIWDDDGDEIANIDTAPNTLNSVSFTTDGIRIITVNDENDVKVWGDEGNELFSIEEPGVWTTAISADGSLIAAGDGDGRVTVWRLDGSEVASLEGSRGGINAIRFSPDGAHIATAGHDEIAVIWDLDGYRPVSFAGLREAVSAAAFSPDGTMVVTGSAGGSVRIWDRAGRPLAVLAGHIDRINTAVFSQDSAQILTASADGTARVWDTAGRQLAILEGHADEVNTARFNGDGSRIVTAGADGTARVWSADGNELALLEGHEQAVTGASFDSEDSLIVTTGSDGIFKIWDMAGTYLAQYDADAEDVPPASISPDGSRLLFPGHFTATLHNRDGEELIRLVSHPAAILSAAFSPDGQKVLTSGAGGQGKVWDLEGALLASLTDHHDRPIYSASFSPDVQYLVTAGDDGTAKLWDVAGNQLTTITPGQGPVLLATFSPDGEQLLTVSENGHAGLWNIFLSLESKVEAAGSRLVRGFSRSECERFFVDDLSSCPNRRDKLFALFEDELGTAE